MAKPEILSGMELVTTIRVKVSIFIAVIMFLDYGLYASEGVERKLIFMITPVYGVSRMESNNIKVDVVTLKSDESGLEVSHQVP